MRHDDRQPLGLRNLDRSATSTIRVTVLVVALPARLPELRR